MTPPNICQQPTARATTTTLSLRHKGQHKSMKISILLVLKSIFSAPKVAEGAFALSAGVRSPTSKTGLRTSTSPIFLKTAAASSGDDDVVLVPADPRYSTHGPIGQGEFTVSREGVATDEEMSNENILLIMQDHLNPTDLEVNTLIWKCLGYRFDVEGNIWTNEEVFPKWKENFPEPPGALQKSA